MNSFQKFKRLNIPRKKGNSFDVSIGGVVERVRTWEVIGEDEFESIGGRYLKSFKMSPIIG